MANDWDYEDGGNLGPINTPRGGGGGMGMVGNAAKFGLGKFLGSQVGWLGGPAGAALMSFGPALLSRIFGGNPEEEHRRKIMAMISPEAIERRKQIELANITGGQGFHMANRMAMMGGQAAINSMSSNLAQRGLSGSGIGSIAPGLGGMAITNQRSNLLAGADQMAGSQAYDRQYQMAGLSQQQAPHGMTRPLLGAGMNAFGPYMMDWFRKRQNMRQGGQNNQNNGLISETNSGGWNA